TVSSSTGTAITVRSATVSATDKTVTLTLSRAVANGETVHVSYTKPATGAVVQDAAGNDAADFGNRAVSNNTPDTTPPAIHSATVTGDQLVLTYTETNSLDPAALAGNAGFTVSSTTGTPITVRSATVSATDKTVTLTLSRAVANGETVHVSYTKPATGAVVQDAAGNDAADFGSRAVTNNMQTPADTTPPLLGDVTVNGNQLELRYTDANQLDASHIALASAFALSSSGAAAIRVSSVAVTGKTVTLTLSRAVASNETLTLSYTKPATGDNAIQDAAGNDAASFGDQAVENLTPAPAPAPGPGPAPAPAPEKNPGAPNADYDGVPDAQENQAIGPKGSTPGDGNNDGIQDSAQAAVASFSAKTSSGSGTSVTLVADSQDGKVPSDSSTRITSLEQKAAPAQTPKALETPIALTSFKATLETAGSTETFSLYVDPKIGANGYWLQDHSDTWVNLASSPYGGKMVDEGGRLRLDFTITDGGQFDADGKADGVITAPGAAAQMPLSIVGQAPDMAHDGLWF
ncbi:SwmB domain-containing protein, partial [Verminephrobacter aporrectodeae]